MKKIIASILIMLLAIGTLGAVSFNVRNNKSQRQRLAALSERQLLLTVEKKGLLEEKAEYVALRAEETRAGNFLVLFFDNVDENLYDVVYPMLDERDIRGTIVLCEGLVPGEEGNISRENFDELISKGWDTAIGYDSSIDMTQADSKEKLGAYLDDYIARLTAAGIEIPLTYCFGKGEYSSRFEDVLKERGFKAIRHSGETGDVFGSAFLEDEFYYIGSGICCAATSKLQENVDQAYQEDLSYSMSVRYIADTAIDTKLDCTTSKYNKMLNYLQNSCPSTEVCTMSELYTYKQQQFTSAQGVIAEYNAKIEELDDKIKVIDAEIEEIISSLNY